MLPVIDSFRERRHGQICILSSVAGLGMNFISPMYSSTKMANFAFGEGILCVAKVMSSSSVHALSIRCFRESRLSWYTSNIKYESLGYTDTPILDTNTGKNASYILKVEDVAATIIDGLKHDYSVIECNMV